MDPKLLTILAAILKGGSMASDTQTEYGFVALAKDIWEHTQDDEIALAAAHIWAGQLAHGMSALYLGHETVKIIVQMAKDLHSRAEAKATVAFKWQL